jgi:hypothetical protein
MTDEKPALRFSLRKLFLATTLIATVIGAAANYPVVLIATLCLVSPFLFTASMAYFATHLHVVERSLLLAIGMAVLLAFLFGCMVLLLDGR